MEAVNQYGRYLYKIDSCAKVPGDAACCFTMVVSSSEKCGVRSQKVPRKVGDSIPRMIGMSIYSTRRLAGQR
jgi:hypothetical protein